MEPERTLQELPLSLRRGESLATLIPTETLEHHMVLPKATEERFARIEAEFAARDRLERKMSNYPLLGSCKHSPVIDIAAGIRIVK